MAITFTTTLEIIQGVPLLRLPKEASALLPTRRAQAASKHICTALASTAPTAAGKPNRPA